MSATEPELITIIEGPTPEFQAAPQDWVQSIHEGPLDQLVATCQLRTGNGTDIMERSRRAWAENRLVQLDFPDQLRMRQRVDVLALRLQEVEEGELLNLWVSLPIEYDEYDDDDDDDDDEEEDFFDEFDE